MFEKWWETYEWHTFQNLKWHVLSFPVISTLPKKGKTQCVISFWKPTGFSAAHCIFKNFTHTFSKLFRFYTFMFLTLLKIVTVNKEPLSFLLYLPCKFLVLVYLRMALQQAKTCSTHVKVTIWTDINLCFLSWIICSLHRI